MLRNSDSLQSFIGDVHSELWKLKLPFPSQISAHFLKAQISLSLKHRSAKWMFAPSHTAETGRLSWKDDFAAKRLECFWQPHSFHCLCIRIHTRTWNKRGKSKKALVLFPEHQYLQAPWKVCLCKSSNKAVSARWWGNQLLYVLGEEMNTANINHII